MQIALKDNLSPLVMAAAERVGRAVVQVSARDQAGRPSGQGSGIIWDEAGRIVTNAHVVRGAARLQVTFHDGVTRAAEIVAADAAYDLALIKAAPAGYPAAAWAQEEAIQPGRLVLAVGNPFGFGWSVSMGVISHTERALGPLDGLLQTDAAINPGNSGGPLASLEGEVVGVTTMMIGGAQNLGFAIPGPLVQQVVRQFLSDGRAYHPWIGIAGQSEVIDPQWVQDLGLPANRGALVDSVVRGGPADSAGIQAFDLIVAVDGEAVGSVQSLRRHLRGRRPGERVRITVLRGGRLTDIPVRLGEMPEQAAAR